MNIRRHSTVFQCLCGILLYVSLAFSQPGPQPTVEVYELRFEQAVHSVSQLQEQEQALRAQIQQKGETIADLKSKGKPGYLEQQKLQALLEASQELGEKVAALEAELRDAKKSRSKRAQELLRLYDKEIAARLERAQEKSVSKPQKKTLLKQIKILRQKRQQVREAAGIQPVSDIAVSALSISPDDSPRQIRQKADLLKDQEDKLRRLAETLEERRTGLRQELDLRTRMGELVSDLALFDQQDEVLTEASTAREAAQTGLTDTGPRERGQISAAESGLGLVGQKVFDYETLSTGQLEELVARLAGQRQRAASQADSLAARAKAFYQAAEEFRKR